MTREPFMNPRTGAIHFEEEESNDGTSDMVDSSNNPVDNREYEIGEDDFDLLSPIETELEQDEPLPTLGEYCLIGFHTASVDAEHAAKRLREAISRCYSAAQEIDERQYDRIGD